MLPEDSDGARDDDLGYDNSHDSHLGDLEKICGGQKTCTTTVCTRVTLISTLQDCL